MPRRFRALLVATITAAFVSALLPTAPAPAATGGPDFGGYTYTDSTEPGGPAGGPFKSISPESRGKGVDVGNHCDGCTTAYTLPFAISLYDKISAQVLIGSDGYLWVGEDTGLITHWAINAYRRTDLRTDLEGTGVYARTTGPSGHRTTILEWLAATASYQYREQFQIVVHEDSDDIELRYLDITDDREAMVGISDGYLALPYNVPVRADLAVRFSRDLRGEPTTTTLEVSPTGGSVHGQVVNLRAAVRSVDPADGPPTGSVTFYSDTTEVGTVPLSADGRAALRTSRLPTDYSALRAKYTGDDTHRFSVSPAEWYEVAKAPTVTTLTASSETMQFGKERLVVKVRTLAPGRGTPTGNVNVFDETRGFLFGTSLVDGAVPLPAFALRPGSYRLSVDYQGDEDRASSGTGTTVLVVTTADTAITVKAAPSPARSSQ